jgi:hypothetical protein
MAVNIGQKSQYNMEQSKYLILLGESLYPYNRSDLLEYDLVTQALSNNIGVKVFELKKGLMRDRYEEIKINDTHIIGDEKIFSNAIMDKIVNVMTQNISNNEKIEFKKDSIQKLKELNKSIRIHGVDEPIWPDADLNQIRAHIKELINILLEDIK